MKRLFTASALILAATANAQWVGNGNDLSNTNLGNVGIGTATPTAKLHVAGSVNLSTGNRLTIGGTNAFHMAGTRNVAMGPDAGTALLNGGTGTNNIFVGDGAGEANTTGSRNVFFGYQAGQLNTTGSFNIAIGTKAGGANTTASNNVFIGFQSGLTNQIGVNNNYIGYYTGRFATGSNNTFFGHRSGENTSTGENNTFIGRVAGQGNTTGTGNTYIGSNARGNAAINNATAIGIDAQVTQSNSVVIGSSITNMGVGVSAPTAKLDVDGQVRIRGGAPAQGKVLTSDANGLATWQTPSAGGFASGSSAGNTPYWDGASWVTNSSNIFNNGGNVGIGTTSPSRKLHVAGSARITGALYDSNDDEGLNDMVLTSTVNGTDWKDVCAIIESCDVIQGLEAGGWGYDSVAVQSQSGQTGMQTFMFMNDPGALVGIGTSTPVSKLSIETDGLNPVGSLMQSAMSISITGSAGQTVRSAKFSGGGGVEVGNGLITDKVKITDGAADGKVLMSSATGDASWVDAVAAGLSGGWTNDSVSVMSFQADTSFGEQGGGNWIQTNFYGLISTLPQGAPLLFGGYSVDYDSAEQNAGRMTYMPTSGAFRAGFDDQNNWGLANQGVGSSAMGWNTKASGDYSDAAGYYTEASGYGSTARGTQSVASGGYSFAVGQNSTASGLVGMALGAGCDASGHVSFAGGSGSTASGLYSTSVGLGNTASGFGSTSFGSYSVSSGSRSFTSGYYNTAQSYGETVLGVFGNIGAGNANSFISTDRLFAIGNGTSTTSRSDALTVLKNGNTGIGISTPGYKLHVQGDGSYSSYILNISSLYTGGTDIRGINVTAAPSNGNGYGIYSTGGYMGIRAGTSSSTSSCYAAYNISQGSGGSKYGTYGYASSGGTGSSYGIFGVASGGSTVWAGYFSGSAYATGTFQTSDIRLKRNINDMQGALNLISKLKVHSYEFRTEEFPMMHLQEGTRYGFLASELKEVLPQYVKRAAQPLNEPEDEKGERQKVNYLEFDAVNYVDIIPVLVKGMQEQQQQIDALTPQNSVSREEFDAIRKENDELKTQMAEILSRLNAFDTDLQQCCFSFENGTKAPSSGSGQDQGQGTSAADAPKLEQNQPNPFHENTTIRYYLPTGTRTASITISDLNGVQLKTFDLSGGRGAGQVLIGGGAFAAGTYVYALTVDGKQVDSKRMVLM